MPVLLAPGEFEAWLHATDEQAHALVRKDVPAVPLMRRAGAPRAATRQSASPSHLHHPLHPTTL
jgi:putative SOS response-associated peptidase YedK